MSGCCPWGHPAWGLAHRETPSLLILGKQELPVSFCYFTSMQLDAPIQITLCLKHICKWIPDQLFSPLKRNYCQNWKCAWFAKGKGKRRQHLRTQDLNLKEKMNTPFISQTAFCSKVIYVKPIKWETTQITIETIRGHHQRVKNVVTQLHCAPDVLSSWKQNQGQKSPAYSSYNWITSIG